MRIFLLLLGVVVLSNCKKDTAGQSGSSEKDPLEARIQADPENPDLYIERAKEHFLNASYDNAILDIERAVRIDSTNVTYYHLLSDVFINYYQSRKALKTLEKALSLEPKNLQTLVKYGEMQVLLKQYPQALLTSQRILSLDPQNEEAFFIRGLLFKEQGRDTLAITNFQRCVDLNPDNTDAFLILGDLHEKQGSPLSEQYYKNAVNSNPESIQAQHAMAYHYQNHEKTDQALVIYDRIKGLDKQYMPAYANKGILYLEMDSLESAITEFRAATAIDTSFAEGYYYIANCYKKMGDIPKARENYKQALAIDPKYQEAEEELNSLTPQ